MTLFAEGATRGFPAILTFVASTVALLTLAGFFLAARAYKHAKAVEILDRTNEILRGEVHALKESRDRMEEDLAGAQVKIGELTRELIRVSARTDLLAHQKHLDEHHSETIAVLTRIADESAARNGAIADMMVEALSKLRSQS